MLRNAWKLARSSFRLLVRSKAFLVVGFIIPFAATLFINLWSQGGVQETTVPDTVVELETMDAQIAYMTDFNCLAVKVYDCRGDDFSRSLCERLTSAGLFQIFRADCTEVSLNKIEADAKVTALGDKVGAVLILAESEDETRLYRVGDDSRFELLQNALELCWNAPIASAADIAPLTTYVTVKSDDNVDYYATRHFSFCLAFASLAFIFGGVMILNTIITEKQDHVYSRIMLTGATRGEYLLSKALLVVGVSLVQALVMAVCFALFVTADTGLSLPQFALLVFLAGLILDLFAVCSGLFVHSVFGAALLSFSVWSVTTLLSGCYFNISSASETYRKIALALPQRWTLITAQKMLDGSNDAYPIILGVTAAYLIVIMVMGIIGLKISEKE